MIDLARAERIAVFRALVLGDLLCATPALRALRAAAPRARITLIGLPWAREWSARVPQLDDFIAFPGHPAMPERAAELDAWPAFLEEARARRFDLVVQLHGSGGVSNVLLGLLGAPALAAFAAPGAWRPAGEAHCIVPWPAQGHEIERLLALTDALGALRQGLQPDWPLREGDAAALDALCAADGTPLRAVRRQPFAVVHAGAQLPSRRWGIERFAAVGNALADAGLPVVLTGTAPEAPLVDALRRAMRRPGLDLAGRTTLWTMGALVAEAALVVCNDTGISHVAAALGTPSVVVSCGADAARWAPLDRTRHAVFAQSMECRPCAFRDCPHAHHPCAAAITPEAVSRAALALRRTGAARAA